jgi:hypothetical protein
MTPYYKTVQETVDAMRAYRQRLIDWLPEKSRGRELDWTRRERPNRVWDALNACNPTDSKECEYCIELATWYCDLCKLYFCKYEECKQEHEDCHTLGRLAGPD